MGIGRKGMSPLIATVLLMAFAVALGGMIMNWSIDRSSDSACDGVKVEVTRFCSMDNAIVLSLTNTKESIPLREIKIEYNEGGYDSSLRIKDSQLPPGRALGEISIPAAIKEGTAVNVVGVIGTDSSPLSCPKPITTANPLPRCQA